MKRRSKIKAIAVIFSVFFACVFAFGACGAPRGGSSPETVKSEGTITDISDISKTYDGKAVENPTYETNNKDGKVSFSYYTRGSATAISAPVNAGEYTVKVSIAEGSTVKAVQATKDFTIARAVATYTVPETLCSLEGAPLSEIDLSRYHLAWVDENTLVNAEGDYSARVSVDETNYCPDSTVVRIHIRIVGEIVELPTLNRSFEYDGEAHSVSQEDIVNFNADKMQIVIKSTLLATEPGTYIVYVTLLGENSCWSDRTDGELALVWNIGAYTITCVSGTKDIYTITANENGETTVTFGAVSAKSEYSLSGELNGNIVLDTGDDYKFELSLCGATISSEYQSPIVILSGDEVTVSAKNGYTNYVYDNRPAVTDENAYSSGIYSTVDLVIGGKGSLTYVSENNNGIHTKDDLEVKNLTLSVKCVDNALKGNDSVKITSGTLTLIATQGDGIKSSNSEKKYNSDGSLKKIQGTVSILSGSVTIYAACDGIDASYDAQISGGKVNIYTDKYSEYSEEVTAVSGGIYYIRYTSNSYRYSVKYYNDDGSFVWKNAEYYTYQQSGGFRPGQSSVYYYYKVEKPTGYSKMILYIYSASQEQGQGESYASCANLTVNNSYDTIAIGSNSVSFTNYTTSTNPGMGGMGGMDSGNTDKGDYSTKGIKADNEILIEGGELFIKSYDDALHTNNDVVLGDEDDATDDYYGTGDIHITGGTLTLYSNDDGIHADGTLTLTDGTVNVTNSYEGLEGKYIVIQGGNISVTSSDDGVNATATSGEGIKITGGTLFVYAGGDGLDSNSKTSYDGILFAGGRTVVINTSGGNSPIDTEGGYKYTAGYVVAIGSSSGMWSESIKCNSNSGFSSVGCYKNSVSSASYIVVDGIATVKMQKTMTSVVIVLGGGTSNSIISTASTSSASFDDNGVSWNV